MATRAQKIKVGAWLIINAAILVGGLLLISGYRHGEQVPYWMEFEEESVLGLYEGATVEYQGVPVGTVRSIFVTEENIPHVDILVDAEKVTLRKGVNARLVLFSFATGILYISLHGGDADAEMLPPESEIPTQASVTKSLTAKFETLFTDISKLVDTLVTGMEDMEPGAIGRVVSSVEAFVQDARKFVASAQETVEDLRGDARSALKEYIALAEDVTDAAAEVKGFFGTASDRLEDFEVARTQQEVRELLQSLKNLSDRLEDAVDGFETASSAVVHDVDTIQYNMSSGIRTIKEAFDALRELLELLQKDPSVIVRGRGE